MYNAKKAEAIVRYFLEIGAKRPPDMLSEALVMHRNDDGKLDWLVEDLLAKAKPGKLPKAVLCNTVHLPYAKRLLELGASATEKDSMGATPLHYAARFGDKAMMALLVEHGAKLTAKDGEKMTPLDYAKDWQRKDNVALLKKWAGTPPRSAAEISRDLEATLAADIKKSVAAFAKKHAKEQFYGFVLDCNAAYGDVLFCFDPTTNPDAHVKDMKYGPGSFKYREERKYDLDGLAESAFLELVSRVLVRLELEDGFAPLQRTAKFTTLAVDHDEPLDVAWKRMDKVRAATSTGTASRSRAAGSRRAAGRQTSPSSSAGARRRSSKK
jgi:ankyrin repeat protein